MRWRWLLWRRALRLSGGCNDEQRGGRPSVRTRAFREEQRWRVGSHLSAGWVETPLSTMAWSCVTACPTFGLSVYNGLRQHNQVERLQHRNLKLERPVGVYEGDGTLSVHPCHVLFVAENSESRSPFSRQSGSYHFVCGSAAPSTRPSSQASALVTKAACRPGPWTRRRLLPRSCIHLRTHTRAPAQPHQSTQQLSLTWIERLARR